MLTRLASGVIWAVCFVSIAGVLIDPAVALEPNGGRHFRGCYSPYPADFTELYKSGHIPTPPYFALHPPVYYSLPVARPYGYGPFAYPPQTMTPKAAPTPKVIQNKFVPSLKETTKQAAREKVAATPVRIVNPFVADGKGKSKSSKRRVKIVYPELASLGR